MKRENKLLKIQPISFVAFENICNESSKIGGNGSLEIVVNESADIVVIKSLEIVVHESSVIVVN